MTIFNWILFFFLLFVLFTFGKVTVWIVSRSGMRSVKIFSFPMYCSSLQSPISAKCLGFVTTQHSRSASMDEKHQIVQHYSHRIFAGESIFDEIQCNFSWIYLVQRKFLSTQKKWSKIFNHSFETNASFFFFFWTYWVTIFTGSKIKRKPFAIDKTLLIDWPSFWYLSLLLDLSTKTQTFNAVLRFVIRFWSTLHGFQIDKHWKS